MRRAGAPGDPSAGAGPGSLAELACRASAVFTDSYHECLLALLFGTPVKAFARRGLPQGLDMSSRMRTLDRALVLGGALSSPPRRRGPLRAGAVRRARAARGAGAIARMAGCRSRGGPP